MLPNYVRGSRPSAGAGGFFLGSSDSRGDYLSTQKVPEYIRRISDFKQMDFEATFDQLHQLISADPSKAYIPFFYRKQTKNHWARDDPAFVVVQITFLAVASLAYAIAFKKVSFWGYLWSVLYTVVVDYFLVGMVISSACSYIANKHLRQQAHSHSVEQEVEWLYAFDVHSNSFFCSFLVTYVLQYFFLPLLIGRNIASCLLANSIYATAWVWYAYITHLGYRALPFLANTQVYFWYPCVAVATTWVLLAFLRLNVSRIVMAFHYG